MILDCLSTPHTTDNVCPLLLYTQPDEERRKEPRDEFLIIRVDKNLLIAARVVMI